MATESFISTTEMENYFMTEVVGFEYAVNF